MIKNFLLIIILLILTTSCGKKADPKYNESNYKYTNQKYII